MLLNDKEKKFLLDLARQALEQFLKNGQKLKIEESSLPSSKLKIKGATFVSLYSPSLRGCRGHLWPVLPLYQDVIDNALSSAFLDDRFLPLKGEELKDLKIEIALLSRPIKIAASSPQELLAKIKPQQDGLIIKKGVRHATFLPSVWSQLPQKEDFLSRLCLKAGLSGQCWQAVKDLEVYKYEVEAFCSGQ